MTGDARTDAFSSAAGNTSDSGTDPRTAAFLAGPSTDPYDAEEFERRVGRVPNPYELANFKATKGVGWAGDPGQKDVLGPALDVVRDSAVGGAVELGAGGIWNTGVKAISGFAGIAGSPFGHGTDWQQGVENNLTYQPRGAAALAAEQDLSKVRQLAERPSPLTRAVDVATAHSPAAQAIIGAGSEAITQAGPLALGLRLPKFGGAEVSRPGVAPEVPSAPSGSSQSISAAAASPDLSAASPELQQAAQSAARRSGGVVNQDALQAHIEADQHGVQLMKGQATSDPIRFSQEQNSTHPDIAARLNAQNVQMTDALDNIRREASQEHVANDAIENGQTVVDALKAHDEPINKDISAKYKALTDANGGEMPIDTGAFLGNVNALLKKNYLTDSVPPAANELLSSLKAGEPMDFEGYEAARSRLAEAQRKGGSEGMAAKIIRGQLEQLPLSPEAQSLKGLADTARAAAKARFDALDADPAYEAAVDDAANGVKKGAPSPLADKFLDKYALSAPKANLDLMMGKLDESARGAVASHALNAIRKQAINPSGNVLPNGYNAALEKYGPKLDSLVSPQTQESLESLGRVITKAKVAPPGAHVNYSKSGVIMNAAQSLAEGYLNTKTGGLYGVAKRVVGKHPDEAMARDSLKPYSGIDEVRGRPSISIAASP